MGDRSQAIAQNVTDNLTTIDIGLLVARLQLRSNLSGGFWLRIALIVVVVDIGMCWIYSGIK